MISAEAIQNLEVELLLNTPHLYIALFVITSRSLFNLREFHPTSDETPIISLKKLHDAAKGIKKITRGFPSSGKSIYYTLAD